jgi:ERCC4-type nuclease
MNKYILYIDNREAGLIEKLNQVSIKNFSVKVCALKVGDIVISKDIDEETLDIYKNAVLIFERKTCSDLLSSINDGRYREQKSRLLANFKKSQICYIIENEISSSLNKYRKSGRQIVIGALVNKCFRDEIKTIKTKNIDETCDFLENICKKVVSNLEFFEKSENIELDNSLIPQDTYAANIKIAKKDNITPERFGILSLTIIPGISAKIASTLICEFKGLPNLILEINKLNGEEEAKVFLKKISDIQLDITGGKKRRVGIKIAEKMYQFLIK